MHEAASNYAQQIDCDHGDLFIGKIIIMYLMTIVKLF